LICAVVSAFGAVLTTSTGFGGGAGVAGLGGMTGVIRLFIDNIGLPAFGFVVIVKIPPWWIELNYLSDESLLIFQHVVERAS
jgi:hypothetical protein